MRFVTCCLLLAVATVASAQPTPGHCAPGTASADLDVSDVLARVSDNGALFLGRTHYGTAESTYVIPSATTLTAAPQSPIFSASLWIGGKVEDEIRMAASTYTNFEFWPGPLGADATPPDDCADYDRIYTVSRDDVRRYLETGEATADLLDWPAHLGAPVLDGDGVAGNYDLAAGDQPGIWGSQSAWWVMNDAGGVHESTESPPLGIEVQGTAFAVALPTSALDRATFYRYRILNRSGGPIDSMYVALWMDVDLGEAADDYVGSDTTYALGYAYNGGDRDADYGVPPAVGVQVVQGPVGLPNGRDDDGNGVVDEVGERLGMTAFSDARTLSHLPVDPVCPRPHYNLMQGLFCDGTPITEGGDGYYTGGEVTTFMYPGDPVTGAFWSERSEDNAPGDRRLVVVTGPFRLAPGGEEEVVFAIPFAWASSALGSVTALRDAAQVMRNAWAHGLLAPTRVEGERTPPPPALAVVRPIPNPFTDRLAVRFSLPEPMAVRLALYDVLGREVAVLVDGEQTPGEHEVTLDGDAFAPGVYFVRLGVPGGSRTLAVTRAAR